jgi:uncharacterized protein YoxC/gas vesicle protein
MNKKFLHGLLAVSLLCGTACAFTSCKDTDEDIYARLKQELLDENASLQEQIDAQKDALTTLKNDLTAEITAAKCNCADAWTALGITRQQLLDAVNDNTSDIATNAGNISALQAKVEQQAQDFEANYAKWSDLQSSLDDINTALSILQDPNTGLLDRVAAIETTLSGLDARLDNLKDEINTNTVALINQAVANLPAIEQKANDAYNLADQANTTADTALTNALQALTDANNAKIAADQAQTALDALKAGYTGTISDLDTRVGNLETTVGNLSSTLNSHDTRLTTLETKVQEIDNLSSELDGVKTDVTNKYNELNNKFNDYVTLTEFNNTISNINTTLDGKVNSSELETLVRNFLSNELAQLAQNGEDITALKAAVEALQNGDYATRTELNTVKSELKTLIDQNSADIADLKTDVTELKDSVSELNTRVDKLTGRLEAIANKLNAMISSIVVQNVANPIFGSITTPLGVNTNILLAYYGEVAHPVQFPYGGSQYEYNNKQVLSGSELGALGVTAYTNPSGIMMDASEGNAGKVYLTVNPSSIDATGTSFLLVNSKDEESGIQLSPLAKSNTELKFGYSRADNGFYVAKATLPAEKSAIDKVKINIESGLKSAMSSVLKDRTRSNVQNLLVQLCKQFAGLMPAEGVKAPWSYTDENGKTVTAATYSNYGIAATAFQPLSYKFLYDSSLPTIPTISTISQIEFDTPSFDFDIKPITLKTPDLTLQLELSKISITIDNEMFAVTVDDFPIDYDPATETFITEKRTFYVDNLEKFQDSLNEQINAAIESWPSEISASVEQAVKDAIQEVTDDLTAQIDDMLNDISGQISDKVSDLITDIQDEVNDYVDRANEYLDRVNSVINRINARLAQPNHYLQVMMAYKANNGGYYQLSTSKKNPTIFTHNGGTAINLIATSYTAEIVVPSFKKYIAVTNVYNADGTTNESLKKQANATGSFNEVIKGTQRRVALNIPTSASGCTYEIVYSSLDYHGVTSTQKYYLKVK